MLMLRARALKAARARSKAAAKAAKAAAEAAASSGSPDIIAANTHSNNDLSACTVPEVDAVTFVHQRAIAAVATLVQVISRRVHFTSRIKDLLLSLYKL